MGLKPNEVKALTLGEFNLMLTGYQRRQDIENNRTRQVMAFILNYSGMGAKEYHAAESLWPLAIDKENEKRMITSLKMAKELLKEFEPY
jgi:hypothetical protein